MNKDNIMQYIIHNTDKKIRYKKLLRDMESAKSDIDVARSMFNNVCDDYLIEVAIYTENVARKRYEYLLSVARKKGVKVDYEYIFDKNSQLAE